MLKGLERHAVEGNEVVIECLEHMLERARLGKINYVGVVFTQSPTDWSTTNAGVYGMEAAAITAMEQLKARILKNLDDRCVQQTAGAVTTADHVIFNLAKSPISFDFLGWLIESERTRVRENAPFPLKVQWYFGKDNNKQACLNSEQRAANFEGILRPMLKLIGAVELPYTGQGRLVESVSLLPAVEGFKNGEGIPVFIPPAEIQEAVDREMLTEFGKPPVTITLREAEHWPHRNSNMTEWLKLAAYLEEQGEKVLFIRDTAKAGETIAGYKICEPAARDLLVRAAVYRNARANLFVSNGPAMIAVFMDAPWLIFNELQNDGPYPANTSEGWYVCAGIDPPGQWPWSGPNQRIVWANDTFPVMKDAWERYIASEFDVEASEAAE